MKLDGGVEAVDEEDVGWDQESCDWFWTSIDIVLRETLGRRARTERSPSREMSLLAIYRNFSRCDLQELTHMQFFEINRHQRLTKEPLKRSLRLGQTLSFPRGRLYAFSKGRENGRASIPISCTEV